VTAAERGPCEHWCRAVNEACPGPCDCGNADIRAIADERNRLRALLAEILHRDQWTDPDPDDDVRTGFIPASTVDDWRFRAGLT
jgi:hypothetical protein